MDELPPLPEPDMRLPMDGPPRYRAAQMRAYAAAAVARERERCVLAVKEHCGDSVIQEYLLAAIRKG